MSDPILKQIRPGRWEGEGESHVGSSGQDVGLRLVMPSTEAARQLADKIAELVNEFTDKIAELVNESGSSSPEAVEGPPAATSPAELPAETPTRKPKKRE